VSATYLASFPPKERVPFDGLVDDVVAGTRTLWVDRSATAMAITTTLRSPDRDVMLEYLAVDPVRRNAGAGGRLLDHLLARIDGPIVLEVEDPAHSDDVHSTRRLRFYERHGCAPVECAQGYVMPVVEDGTVVATVPMRLYEVVGRPRIAPLRGTTVRALICSIWVDSYECSLDDPRLRETLSRLACRGQR
jgi:GNAT superfamily N-acetyltransferase